MSVRLGMTSRLKLALPELRATIRVLRSVNASADATVATTLADSTRALGSQRDARIAAYDVEARSFRGAERHGAGFNACSSDGPVSLQTLDGAGSLSWRRAASLFSPITSRKIERR